MIQYIAWKKDQRKTRYSWLRESVIPSKLSITSRSGEENATESFQKTYSVNHEIWSPLILIIETVLKDHLSLLIEVLDELL